MSDNNMNARIDLSVEDRASAVVRTFRGEIDKTTKALKALVDVKMPAAMKAKLDGTGARKAVDNIKQATEAARRLSGVQAQASRQRQSEARTEAKSRRMFDAADVAALKNKLGFQARMGRQRSQEQAAAERQRRAYDAAALRDFRERFRFMTAIGRQRLAETREAERAEAAANRTRIAAERQVRHERERTHQQAVRYGQEAFTRGRDAVREIARPPAAVAAVGTAGAVAGARRVLKSEGNVDAAEINARIYGGLSKDAARKLRDMWAAPLAEALGAQTDKLLNAYVDATKIGIPAAGAHAFAELATKTSEAWGVPFETVTDTLGTVNSILTSKGAAYDGKRLRSVANTLQHLAAKQSTTPEKLISFLQRGAGGADVLGMSMESALAFGSASTSLGNQAGQSGSLLDYIAGRVVELPKLTRQHGQEGRQARKLLDALGYGGVDDVEARRRQDPDSFLPDLMERFSKIQDPKQQDEAIRFFAGREWLGEFGRMVKGADTYREAVKLSKEAKGLDAIAAVWDLHKLKLSFVFKQFGAGWTNILGEFGKVLSPMARQAGDYWLAWTAKLRAGGLQARFRAALDGLIEGFGFRNLPDMLKGILGTPGEGDAGAISTWKATAREFSAGIRDVVGSIKSVVSAFTGGSPEVIARWTGRILALSAALMLLSPVLGVLGGIISGIVALASAAASVAAAAKLAGAVGGTGAAGSTAGGIVGAGFWTAAGGLIAVAFLGAVAKHLNILNPPDMSKGLGRGILEFLDPGLASRIYGDRQPETGQGSTWTDPSARVQRQSASEDWRGLIKPASFSPMEDLTDSVDRLDRTLNGQGARVQLAAFGTSTLSAVGRAASIGGGDGGVSAQGGGAGFGPSGFPKAPGMTVPGWYGHGGGSASSNPANSAASAAMLDAIAGTESGKAGYDAVLGNGKYGTPSKAVSTMTLDEAFAFGRTVRARHGSSSALGRYQIVGNTMRAAQRALGLDGSTVFNAETQDRMARWIARNQGLGAWEGLKSNPSAMAAAQAALAQGGAKDVPADATGAVTSGTGGQFDGLRVKGGQATAGGGTSEGVTDLARAAQADLPGGVKHFGAFNDRYHLGTGSKHARGLAFDTTLFDPSKSTEAAEAMRAKLRAAGLSPEAFRVINEYRNPSARSTGGHLHTQFNSREAADAYHRFVRTQGGTAVAGADGITSTGWRKAISPSEAAQQVPTPPKRPSAEDLAGQAAQPRPVRVMPGSGVGGEGGLGNSTTIHAPVTIQAAHHSPSEIAGSLQRHVSEARGFRTHDYEPELT